MSECTASYTQPGYSPKQESNRKVNIRQKLLGPNKLIICFSDTFPENDYGRVAFSV